MTDVAIALKALERDDGRLLPEDVVLAAREPNSPLHRHFTWDDTEAARLRRLDEARALIRSVRVIHTVHKIDVRVPSYVRDPEADAKAAGYRNIANVRTEADQARAAIVNEMERVVAAVQRAKAIAAVLGVDDQVERIDAIAREITTRVSTPQATA